MLRTPYRLLLAFGFDPRRMLYAMATLPSYISDATRFLKQRRQSSDRFRFGFFPCLTDKFAGAGVSDWQYFHQDLYVAQRIFAEKPERHVDVGSRIDGFVSHVASYREIEVIDIRPLKHQVSNIRFVQANLQDELPPHLANYCDSLSCLHALEHFGLGRYGDPIDYDGHAKGIANLHRMLKPGGMLYLSVPIGRQQIEFNAHRIFEIECLLRLFAGRFLVSRLSVVDDGGHLHDDVPVQSGTSCRYGCAIFELRRADAPATTIRELTDESSARRGTVDASSGKAC